MYVNQLVTIHQNLLMIPTIRKQLIQPTVMYMYTYMYLHVMYMSTVFQLVNGHKPVDHRQVL